MTIATNAPAPVLQQAAGGSEVGLGLGADRHVEIPN